MTMMFVPSKGGISHNFTEDTDRADLALGAEVLTEVVASLKSKSRRILTRLTCITGTTLLGFPDC